MAIVLPKFPGHRPSAAHGTARQPAVNITMCREDASYVAGSYLKAQWRVGRIDVDQLQNVEISVMWHTEGKGDEDLGVVHFERHHREDLARVGLAEHQSLKCRLPPSPLSYRGHLLQIDWCVRVRVFLADGREVVTEQPFFVIARQSPVVEVDTELPSDAVEPEIAEKSSGLRWLPAAWLAKKRS